MDPKPETPGPRTNSREARLMKDTVMPEGRWAFDQAVTDAFDDMLRRSIPQYEVMRSACVDLARLSRRPGTDIVDLGCSRGEAMAPLVLEFGDENRFVGVEVSRPMIEAVSDRFKDTIRSGRMRIEELDLRRGYPDCRASVTLAVLTLQFIPIEYRQRVLSEIHEHTIEGGVCILVEKVLGASAHIDTAMVDCYYGLKARNGYSEEAIQRKRLSLEGVLVPITARWNEESLKAAGFGQVDCFWRWMNFAGWIAVK
jgi:tRNA (cmo5U34)-methyltransferase